MVLYIVEPQHHCSPRIPNIGLCAGWWLRCWYARFRCTAVPPPSRITLRPVQELEKGIIKACAGMPLALKLVGARLRAQGRGARLRAQGHGDPTLWQVSGAKGSGRGVWQVHTHPEPLGTRVGNLRLLSRP